MYDTCVKKILDVFKLSDSHLQEIYKRLYKEIQKGLREEKHNKADTKCFVTYVQDLPTGEEIGKYLALDLGGTNFRILLVTLKPNHDALVESKTYTIAKELMLGSGLQLFDHIAECLSIFVNEQQISHEMLPMGFTFSFPCKQLSLTKATLVTWTKGFNCSNVVDEDVGELLRDAIARRGDLRINVMAILNDTIGTLMSCAHINTKCRIGVIIGTGCNACYTERVENVDLLEPELKVNKKYVLINTEWGAFGKHGALDFIRSEYDIQIDEMSLNKGEQIYEKMMSGMYLGELVRLILIRAMNENRIFILSTNKLKIMQVLQTPDCISTSLISEVEGDISPNFTTTKTLLKEIFNIPKVSFEDCQKLKTICECISQRAANLVAIGLSVLINKVNESEVVVGVDGTVYRKHPKFADYMKTTMRKFVNRSIQFDLMLSEDGSGRGAALVAAVASNGNN